VLRISHSRFQIQPLSPELRQYPALSYFFPFSRKSSLSTQPALIDRGVAGRLEQEATRPHSGNRGHAQRNPGSTAYASISVES